MHVVSMESTIPFKKRRIVARSAKFKRSLFTNRQGYPLSQGQKAKMKMPWGINIPIRKEFAKKKKQTTLSAHFRLVYIQRQLLIFFI